MSGLDADSNARTRSPNASPTPAQGTLAVALTTSFDAVSTVAGLSLVPVLTERNPFARALFETVGLGAGIALASITAVLVVVLATETAVHVLEPRTDDASDASGLVRTVGYGIPSLLSLSVAVHNVALIATHQTLL